MIARTALAAALVLGTVTLAAAQQGRPMQPPPTGGPVFDDPVWTNPAASTSDADLARAWGLSAGEVERYRELSIKNSRFAVSNISPIEVLGAYEDDPARRQEYARRFVEEHRAQAGRALRWSITTSLVDSDRHTATTDFLRDWPEIEQFLQERGVDTTLFETFKDYRQQVDTAERTATLTPAIFFTDYGCDSACKAAFADMRSKFLMGTIASIDVVFVNTTKESIDYSRVERWALGNSIGQQDIDTDSVSLNHDSGRLRKIRRDRPTPIVVDTEGVPIR